MCERNNAIPSPRIAAVRMCSGDAGVAVARMKVSALTSIAILSAGESDQPANLARSQ